MTFRRWNALLLALSLLGILAACVRLGSRRSDAPPQGWWAARGPVVPHDGFPADCSLCHVGDGWHEVREDFVFDHLAVTGTPLEGAHARAECLRCHNDRGPAAVFAARGCAGCHEDVHRAQLGQDCAQCHEQEDWRPRQEIASHQRTRFPLVGAHASVACWRCHAGGEVGTFTPLDTACVSCHADDAARASDPDHAALGFTDDCERCHVPISWTGSFFTHPGFALTGAHRQADCTACHAGGAYAGTPSDCYACHMDDYVAAGSDHATFPTTCEDCHGTTTWEGASFSHAGIASGCVECHLDEYTATSDPNHVSAGFPTTCEVCHDTNGWGNADFQHSFPLAGPHRNLACADCHVAPQAFSTFSCIDCHEHRQSETDGEHDEVQGYVYESNACLACHPNGRE